MYSLRDLAADDLVEELVALARLGRLEVDTAWPYWPRPPVWRTNLPSIFCDRLADRLAVGDLRAADVRVDVELAHQAVDDDLEVELAHPGDQRLAGLLVGAHAEGRILLGQALQARAELVLVALRLRLDRDRDHRVRERHRLEHDRRGVDGERVARGRSPSGRRRRRSRRRRSPRAPRGGSRASGGCGRSRSVLPVVVFSTRSPCFIWPE